MDTQVSNDELNHDLLTGADAIAEYLNWKKRRVYHASRKGYLPIGRVGGSLIARKSQLKRALTGVASEVAA